MRVLIAGCGYVGLALGADLVRLGHEVFGLRRSLTAARELAAAGLRPLVADLAQPADLAQLPGPFDWVVQCAAAGGGGVEDYRRIYLAGSRHLIAALAGTPLRKFVYTSSTGVYGQNDGSCVDETHPTEPATATGRVLLEAEQALLAAARQWSFPAVVLRVSGIYGPGRAHHLKQFLKNEARIEGAGDRYLNMIHRDDVAGAILAALQNGRPGEVYNAVDDEPVTLATFFHWLASRLGQGPPAWVAEDPPTTRKRGLTNKRVSNRKLRLELGYQFKHPNFRAGFATELQRLRLEKAVGPADHGSCGARQLPVSNPAPLA